MNIKKILTQKRVIFSAAFIALCLCVYFSLGYLAGIFLTSNVVEGFFYEQTGLHLSLDKPQLKTMPDFSLFIRANKMDIYAKNPKECMLSVNKPNLRIKIFPLVVKNVQIVSLAANKLEIKTTRDKDGTFDFEKYLNSEMEFPLKPKFKSSKLKLSNVDIYFVDELHKKKTTLKTSHFFIDDFSQSKSLNIDTDALVQILDLQKQKTYSSEFKVKAKLKFPLAKYLDSKDVIVDASAKNIDLEPLLSYVNEFSSIKFPSMQGIINGSLKSVKTGSQNDFALNVLTSKTTFKLIYKNNLNAFTLNDNAELSAKINASKQKLKINSANFASNGINISLNGEIADYKTKKPDPDINIKIVNCNFIKLVNLVPAGFVEYKTDIINELKHAQPYAKVNGSLNVSGDAVKPDVYGKLDFSDIYLFEKPKNFNLSDAKCTFQGDKVLVDVIVYAPNNEYVRVKGVSELYGKQSGKYDISSTQSVNLAFAQKYLIPVQRVIGFKLGPLPYMKVDGTGRIHIVTDGTIYDATVDGKFSAENIKASLNGLNAQLTDGSIELIFDKKNVIIKNTHAKIYDGMFYIAGNADDYGNMDIKTVIKNINADKALNIAKTSELVKTRTGDISFIQSAKGKIDFTLLLKGKAKSLEGLDFLNEILPSGDIVLRNVDAKIIPGVALNSLNGTLKYAKEYIFNINGKFKNAKITVSGSAEPNTTNLNDKNAKISADIKAKAENICFCDIYAMLNESDYMGNSALKMGLENPLVKEINFALNSEISVKGMLPADYKKTDLSKLLIDGYFSPVNGSNSKNIKFGSGTYKIKNSKVTINNSNVVLYGSNIHSDGYIEDIFSKNPKTYIKIRADKISLDKLNTAANFDKLPALKPILSNFSDFKGFLSADLNIKNNTPAGNVSFGEISMRNIKQNLTLTLQSGSVQMHANKLYVDAFNMLYGATPVYFDAVVDDFSSDKPKFNALFSTNIDENSVDKLINQYLAYPLKIKGEVRLKGRMRGEINNYTVFSYLTVPKDSDISYMGANLGDEDYLREFASRVDFSRNSAQINSAKYIKYVNSQNNKPTPVTMIKVDGNVYSSGKSLRLDNIKIVTPNPVTAKLFNVIFKKSILKQGLFTCNLKINGDVKSPSAAGNINFQDVNIPLYNTKISDVDFNISKNVAFGVLKGKSYDSDIEMSMEIQNNASFPIVLNSLNIKSKKLSLSQVLDGFSQIPRVSSDIVPGQPIVFKPQDLIIKQGSAVADEIELYNIKAQNLKADFSNLTGLTFLVNDMVFDIAGGKINSEGSVDLNTALFTIKSSVKNCDANILAKSFLGLDNQIYGRADADISLSGKSPDSVEALKTIQGKVNFKVNNGKMPKLGSLEYLLRAGNLLKSGVLGLTLNNIIEVLTPYKTGEFSAIRGNFDIKDAKISSLEIYSKGKNLSLFIYGNYDIIKDDADIEVLGRLSKNVSNLLGAIGNASLNSLLSLVTNNAIREGTKAQIIDNVNKIPLIELTGDEYRLFVVKISGSLNSDDYVKSFNWLN